MQFGNRPPPGPTLRIDNLLPKFYKVYNSCLPPLMSRVVEISRPSIREPATVFLLDGEVPVTASKFVYLKEREKGDRDLFWKLRLRGCSVLTSWSFSSVLEEYLSKNVVLTWKKEQIGSAGLAFGTVKIGLHENPRIFSTDDERLLNVLIRNADKGLSPPDAVSLFPRDTHPAIWSCFATKENNVYCVDFTGAQYGLWGKRFTENASEEEEKEQDKNTKETNKEVKDARAAAVKVETEEADDDERYDPETGFPCATVWECRMSPVAVKTEMLMISLRELKGEKRAEFERLLRERNPYHMEMSKEVITQLQDLLDPFVEDEKERLAEVYRQILREANHPRKRMDKADVKKMREMFIAQQKEEML